MHRAPLKLASLLYTNALLGRQSFQEQYERFDISLNALAPFINSVSVYGESATDQVLETGRQVFPLGPRRNAEAFETT